MKAQVAAEFVIYSMIIIVLVATILGVTYSLYIQSNQEKTDVQLLNYGRTLQKELIVAGSVKEGYTRVITIPQTMYGNNFTIDNTNYDFSISFKGRTTTYPTPETTGTLVKGKNTIRYDGNVVILNG